MEGDVEANESEPSAFTQTCSGCGREFAYLNAFTTHSASCRPKKKRLAGALAIAQELYRQRKMRRVEEPLDGAQAVPPLSVRTTSLSNSCFGYRLFPA